MAKVGRPEKIIKEEDFKKLMRLNCTQEEIASYLEVSVNTLKSWCRKTYGKSFTEVAVEQRAAGRMSLRRMLWHHAAKSAAVCIFLAKNELGMMDTPQAGPVEDQDSRRENTKSLSKAITEASMAFADSTDEELADIPDAPSTAADDDEDDAEE